MVRTEAELTTHEISNNREHSALEREGDRRDSRCSSYQGDAVHRSGLGQNLDVVHGGPHSDVAHDLPARDADGTHVARGTPRSDSDVAGTDGPGADPSDFDSRALTELSTSRDDRLSGCSSNGERDAGLVLFACLAIGLVVLGYLLFG